MEIAGQCEGIASSKLLSSPHMVYISLQNSGAVPGSQSTPLPLPARAQGITKGRDPEVAGRSHVLTGNRQT